MTKPSWIVAGAWVGGAASLAGLLIADVSFHMGLQAKTDANAIAIVQVSRTQESMYVMQVKMLEKLGIPLPDDFLRGSPSLRHSTQTDKPTGPKFLAADKQPTGGPKE